MLSMQDKIRIELELRQREDAEKAYDKYKNSLANFVRDCWHILEPSADYVHGWVIDALCEHLQAITSGEIKRLLTNIPPGMMKSLLFSVIFPAWEWGVHKMTPYRYLCASHSQSLAIRDNVKCRRLILSEWYQRRFPHVILAHDQNAKIKFENTELGFREAIAAGSITGSRGDRVIIDDPHSVESAYSDKERKNTEIWFTEAVPTRLNDPKKSAILIIMQRLHEEDVSGIVLSRELGYEHLCLPMEFESARRCKTSIGFSDPRVRDGDLLFPERFSVDDVAKLKSTLGEYATAGQLQQSPIPRGGGIIKRTWINLLDAMPVAYSYKLLAIDSAYKTGEENDFTLILCVGVLNGNVYVFDRIKGKWPYPDLLNETISAYEKHKPHVILIEDKVSGQSLIQSLKRETKYNVRAIKADRDKIVRTHAVTHIFEHGRVFVHNAKWTNDYLDTLCKFPFGAHDDDVDATTMAFRFADEIQNKPKNSFNIDVFTR